MGIGCCGSNVVIEKNDKDESENNLNPYSKIILIKSNYEMLSIVGSGSFGKVRIYRSNICKNLRFAVKTMKKEGIEKPLFNCFKNEINILRTRKQRNQRKFWVGKRYSGVILSYELKLTRMPIFIFEIFR